jgi:NADH-quinone oxidoreductase subunit K
MSGRRWAKEWPCERRDKSARARGRSASAMIGIEHYVVVSSIVFVLGVLGIFLNRKNVIVILMAIELILLAVNLNLVAFSAFLQDLTGQIFAMFVLTVAAGEAAIGLAILVIYFRGRGTIAVDDVNRMRG